MRLRITTTALVILVMAPNDARAQSEEPQLCPAGMYFDQQERCTPCPTGTYTPVPNTFRHCLQHTPCDVQNMISSVGTATHDNVCKCLHGNYWDDATKACVRNLYCPPGEGIANGGQACIDCVNGTYSDRLSNVDPCVPWTNCSDFGWTVISEGTSESDRVCSGQTTVAPVAGNVISSKGKAGVNDRQLLTSSTLSPVGISLIALCSVAVVGICILLAWKGYKHLTCKKLGQEVLSTDYTAEEATLVNEEPVAKAEDALHSVECEEDSNTHPKAKEYFSTGGEQPDSQRLLQHIQDFGHENAGYEGLEDEEPVTEGENGEERSNARDIPQVYIHAGDNAVSSVASTAASSVETSPSSLAYREGAQRLVIGAKSNALTIEIVEHLAAGLGEDWKHLAPGFGLKQYEIDQIINKHRNDIKQQAFAMIWNWHQGKAGEATLSDLEDTLLRYNRLELLSRLQDLHGHAVT